MDSFCFSIGIIDYTSCFLLSNSPGCGYSIYDQPRVEELHPWLHVQRLWAEVDNRELIQAKKWIFLCIKMTLSRHYSHTLLHLSSLYFMHTLVYNNMNDFFSARQPIYLSIVCKINRWCCFSFGLGSDIKHVTEYLVSIDGDTNEKEGEGYY